MINLGDVTLRALASKDVDQLYLYRNDWEVIRHLGGFSAGYSRQNLEDWVKSHSNRADEMLWTIADRLTDRCLGHVGLYQIDSRVRKGQFAILIGERALWGKGLGTRVTSRGFMGLCATESAQSKPACPEQQSKGDSYL